MKYLAILKDSLREAIDAKVFYATVILSVLVSFIVLTVTYQPVPMEDVVKEFTGLMNLLTEMKHPQAAKMNLEGVKHAEVQDFKRLDDGTEPWTGTYRFTMDFELWDDPAAAQQPKGEGNQPPDVPKVVPFKQPKLTA